MTTNRLFASLALLLSLTFASQGWGQVQMDRINPAAVNFIYYVDGRAYTTIQSAITAAGTTGAVVIPPKYAGADTYTNPNNILILDYRNGNLRVGTVTPVFSTTVTGGTAIRPNGQTYNSFKDIGPPPATTYGVWVAGVGNGNTGGSQARGIGGLRIDSADDPSVSGAPSTRGILYGVNITIDPIVARSSVPFDDAAGIVVQNGGTQEATDAYYVGHGSPAGAEWSTSFNSDAVSNIGFRLGGTIQTYGIDLLPATMTLGALRVPNNIGMFARNAGNNADINLIRLDGSNHVVIGDTGTNGTDMRVTNNGGGFASLGISNNATSVATLAYSNGLTLSGGQVAIAGNGTFSLGQTTVASLPSAASNPGAMILVTDSTAVASEGQTCAGSSTNKAVAISNGSSWKCF